MMETSAARRDMRKAVAQLQKVESDIQAASYNLENSFKDANEQSMLLR